MLPPLQRYAYGDVALDIRTRYFAAETMIVREVQTAYAWDIPIQTAIDIGAHIGAWTCTAKQRYPHARIAAVEVEPSNFALLEHNTARWQDVHCYAARCGYTTDDYVIAQHAYNSGSTRVYRQAELTSLDLPAHIWTLLPAPLPITIEQIMTDCGFTQIDVLKLDCEGAEVEILNHLHVWSSIGYIVGEIHQPIADFEAQTNYILQRQGFHTDYTPHPANPQLSTFIARR